MPAFSRFLVLAVLALSASVQSAPAGTDPSNGIVPTEGSMVRAPDADDLGERAISVGLDPRALDDEDGNDLDERDIEEREDSDLDGENVDAASKTKAAPKPPKTTKPAPPKPPKTTKAKTSKTKPTGKPTKPTKTSKATSKPSKTAKPTGTSKPSSCPVKKPPPKKPRAFITRAYDHIVLHLFQRDNEEFIGWHGTNSDTAALWASKGHIEKPTKPDGWLDFLGIGTKAPAGTSGADAQLGPGLYISDIKATSITLANMNALKNKGTTSAFIIRKALIPDKLIGDSSDEAKAEAMETARINHIKKAIPGVTAGSVVKVSVLDPTRSKGKIGQLAIPESIGNQFSAKCFKVEHDAVAASDAAASNQGTRSFPQFSYINGEALQREWNVVVVPGSAGGC